MCVNFCHWRVSQNVVGLHAYIVFAFFIMPNGSTCRQSRQKPYKHFVENENAKCLTRNQKITDRKSV